MRARTFSSCAGTTWPRMACRRYSWRRTLSPLGRLGIRQVMCVCALRARARACVCVCALRARARARVCVCVCVCECVSVYARARGTSSLFITAATMPRASLTTTTAQPRPLPLQRPAIHEPAPHGSRPSVHARPSCASTAMCIHRHAPQRQHYCSECSSAVGQKRWLDVHRQSLSLAHVRPWPLTNHPMPHLTQRHHRRCQ